MCPEFWVRKFVISPVTQTEPTCFSSKRLTCPVNSLTESTRRVASTGNNSPKSHCDLTGLVTGSVRQRLEMSAKGMSNFVLSPKGIWVVVPGAILREGLMMTEGQSAAVMKEHIDVLMLEDVPADAKLIEETLRLGN